MKDPDPKTTIARLLRQSLQGGFSVELDGLGTFIPARGKRFRFLPQNQPRVFIAYVEEDLEHAAKLYDRLLEAGFDPWLDKKKLLAGQNWPRAIEAGIQSADFFIAFFSCRSVTKRGTFHTELSFALECASRIPLDEVFFIPVRIDRCTIPTRITRHIQYVDMFPDWEKGFGKIVKTMFDQIELRTSKELPPAL